MTKQLTVDGYYFFERQAWHNQPGGVTVSKHRQLPTGDFEISEYVWGLVSLWFIDVDLFTDDERQDAYRRFMR